MIIIKYKDNNINYIYCSCAVLLKRALKNAN